MRGFFFLLLLWSDKTRQYQTVRDPTSASYLNVDHNVIVRSELVQSFSATNCTIGAAFRCHDDLCSNIFTRFFYPLVVSCNDHLIEGFGGRCL